MRKRSTLLIALIAILSLVAAACATDEGGSTTTAAPAPETTEGGSETPDTTEAMTDTTEAMDDVDLSGTTVTVFASEESDEAASIQAALDVFAEENGMTITYTGTADFSDQINAQAAGGNPPDIAMFPQPGKVKDFANEGFLLPIPQDVVDVVRPQWPAGTLETYSTDDGVFAFQVKTDLKSIVWYNSGIFADGGYEIPTTQDALRSLTETMVADGVTPWCVGIESAAATGWVFTDWMEDMMLRTVGADEYDRWVAGELDFSDPSVIAVGQDILDWWNAPNTVYAALGSISATHHSSDHGQPLADGTCAMVRQASFFAAFLPEGTTVGPDGDVGTFYFPAADDTSSPVLTAGNAASAFRDAPEVWAVMEYLGSSWYADERQKAQREIKGGDASGFLTANLEADLSLWNDLEATFIGILAAANPARFDASDLMPAAVGAGTFWTEGTSAVNGDKTIEEAFEAIDASWP